MYFIDQLKRRKKILDKDFISSKFVISKNLIEQMKNPYTYPHKTRIAITDYLFNHVSYGGWNHPCRKWSPLAWNVKVNNIDTTGKAGGKGELVDSKLDKDWENHFKQNEQELTSLIFEDSQCGYIDEEYSTYPGNDQGDWKFCFGGRSGGWLILEEWKNTNFLDGFDSNGSWEIYLEELDWKSLKTLYRGVRCMDQDFTRAKASENVSYELNFQRTLWGKRK